MLKTFFDVHANIALWIFAIIAQNIENNYFLYIRLSYIATRYLEVNRAIVYNLYNSLQCYGTVASSGPPDRLRPIGRSPDRHPLYIGPPVA